MVKRKWYWVLAVVVFLCIGSFVIFKPKATLEPIKIYKATPDSKPSFPTETNTDETESVTQQGHDHGHTHAHLHEPAQHSHAAESPINDGEYDWRDDSTFDATLPKSDPWKQPYPGQATDETDETYPPRDWYKTKDPELHAEYLYAQLLKQFCDILEVHIIGEHQLNMAKKLPISIDKYIEYLEASHTLWPNDKTSKLIADLQKDKAEGVEFIFK